MISYVCDQGSVLGVDCRQGVFTVTVWHLIILAIVAPLVGAVIHFFRRHKDISGKNWRQYQRMNSHKRGAVNYPSTLMLNAHTLRDVLNEPGLSDTTLREAAGVLNERLKDKYFLVQFREGGKELFRKELKIRAGWMTLGPQLFRTDPETLKILKSKSVSDEDDETEDNQGAIGEFDIFFRPIANWDIRHWLNHPSREVRIGIWVAMFATALEFGPDLAEFVRALFTTPTD